MALLNNRKARLYNAGRYTCNGFIPARKPVQRPTYDGLGILAALVELFAFLFLLATLHRLGLTLLVAQWIMQAIH